jgi:glucokinase
VGPLYIGIDLGGSNISAALLTPAGKVLHFLKTETLAQQGYKRVVQRMIDLALQLQQEAKQDSRLVKAVGVGVPGVLAIKAGMVLYSPNLPGWKNIPLLKMLKVGLKKPVLMDNDANVAALGERIFGAGKGCDHVVVYTLGTGVGGGIIIDGNIFHGFKDGAGELGHTTILPDGPVCACGNRGCLEALVSGTAIARFGREILASGKITLMRDLCGNKPEALSAKTVFEAAKRKDPVALELVNQTGVYLGIAVANIINLLNPELIIISGGVSIAGETLLRIVRAEVKRRALKVLFQNVKIVKAELEDKAGVFGAAGIAIQAYPARSK